MLRELQKERRKCVPCGSRLCNFTCPREYQNQNLLCSASNYSLLQEQSLVHGAECFNFYFPLLFHIHFFFSYPLYICKKQVMIFYLSLINQKKKKIIHAFLKFQQSPNICWVFSAWFFFFWHIPERLRQVCYSLKIFLSEILKYFTITIFGIIFYIWEKKSFRPAGSAENVKMNSYFANHLW